MVSFLMSSRDPLINAKQLLRLMEKGDDFVNMLDECIKLLDENMDVLNDLEYYIESDREDIITAELTKNELVDMAHEVADSSRIKKAESYFIKRFFEKQY